ncbi:hypothetical protein M0811_04047 [Anaeramoeba ignava]|uniref:Integrator complex subunit 14 beta-barrel domain-containing protein n=1 Tax=Anaeramoeba ignava TaxID=1746090 RepID=A0A9Q0RH00_ANAIG|nr:hypothetical protein M0811_04047 [Anaeramoeba ignava]
MSFLLFIQIEIFQSNFIESIKNQISRLITFLAEKHPYEKICIIYSNNIPPILEFIKLKDAKFEIKEKENENENIRNSQQISSIEKQINSITEILSSQFGEFSTNCILFLNKKMNLEMENLVLYPICIRWFVFEIGDQATEQEEQKQEKKWKENTKTKRQYIYRIWDAEGMRKAIDEFVSKSFFQIKKYSLICGNLASNVGLFPEPMLLHFAFLRKYSHIIGGIKFPSQITILGFLPVSEIINSPIVSQHTILFNSLENSKQQSLFITTLAKSLKDKSIAALVRLSQFASWFGYLQMTSNNRIVVLNVFEPSSSPIYLPTKEMVPWINYESDQEDSEEDKTLIQNDIAWPIWDNIKQLKIRFTREIRNLPESQNILIKECDRALQLIHCFGLFELKDVILEKLNSAIQSDSNQQDSERSESDKILSELILKLK